MSKDACFGFRTDFQNKSAHSQVISFVMIFEMFHIVVQISHGVDYFAYAIVARLLRLMLAS